MRHLLTPAAGLLGIALLSAHASAVPVLGIQLAEAGTYTQTGSSPLTVSGPYGMFSTAVNTGTAVPLLAAHGVRRTAESGAGLWR